MNNGKAIVVRILSAFIFAVLPAGCAVGPEFKRPSPPEVANYTVDPLPDQTVSASAVFGESQRFVEGELVNAQWWQEFNSPKLDGLISAALQASPTLAWSQATLRQAQELYAAQSGSTLYPQVDANLDSQRQRFNPGILGQDAEASEFSLYKAGVSVHYNLDLAGGNRRALESLAAKVDYQRYQLEGAQLTLAANIVTGAVTQARLAAQIQASESILASQEKQLGLVREQVRLGQASPDDELALQTQVEQTRAGIPELRRQLHQSEHLLAVLAGREPGAGGMPSFSMRDFALPTELTMVVPSELVRTRPDIRAAEALLHAANAEYGVAIAKLYPQLDISADLGSQALTTGALFGSGSAIWSIVGQLTQPLFNPGLPAEKRAALAAFDAAAANYRNVVLESLRNVADVLRALENDAQRLAALSAADTAARASLDSVQRQYALGAASYVQLIIAQQLSQKTKIDLVEAQTRRLVDSAALYQAMGGGRSTETEIFAQSKPTSAP